MQAQLMEVLCDYRDILWDLERPQGWKRHYRVWSIAKKSGGRRWIHAPEPRLKEVQQRLVPLLSKFPLHQAARAFRPGYPAHDAVAQEHCRHAGPEGTIWTADIKDFFGHVTDRMLLRHGVPREVILFVTVPHRRQRVLPQGAPTSPPASNLVMFEFDELLSKTLPEDTLYTRYADDIGISAPSVLNYHQLRNLVSDLLSKHGFVLAPKKCRLMTPKTGRSYLGVTFTDRIGLSRRYDKKLRSKRHHHGMGDASTASLQGMLDYVRKIKSCGA